MSGIFRINRGWKLVLASTSPRRRQLLESLGLEFSILDPGNAEPEPDPGMGPCAHAERCARAKGRACRSKLGRRDERAAILAADTVVAIGDAILGKPGNARAALEMLKMLNGSSHNVFTAFSLSFCNNHVWQEKCQSDCSTVRFGNWSETILEAYAASGECLDKAGAYAVQGCGAFLIESIQGSWTNVVGLPVSIIAPIMLEHAIISPA